MKYDQVVYQVVYQVVLQQLEFQISHLFSFTSFQNLSRMISSS